MTEATAAVRGGGDKLRVGDTIALAMGLLGRHLPAMAGLALPSAFLNTLLLQLAAVQAVGADYGVLMPILGAQLLLSLLIYSVTQALIVHAAVQAMRGHRVRIVETLAATLPRFVPIVLVSVMAGVLAGLATLLLVIPGVIVFIMLFVAQPVCVVERLGADASVSRSAALTKGNRWRIFALCLIVFVLRAAVGAVAALLLRAGASVVLIGVDVLVNGTLLAFYGVVTAVVYYQLRVLKEGVDIEQVAAVFG
ncbi:MAG: hypothetical protein U1E53_07155 [Dongiaceae bacterium]